MVVAPASAVTDMDFDEESANYEDLLNILKENYDKDGVARPFLMEDDIKIIF